MVRLLLRGCVASLVAMLLACGGAICMQFPALSSRYPTDCSRLDLLILSLHNPAMPATVPVLPRARAESLIAPCVVPENLLCPAEPQLCRRLAHFLSSLLSSHGVTVSRRAVLL